MEKFLKSELGLERCESTHKHSGGGGCISETKTFNTDKYGKIFVKFHQGSKARLMFEGEYESLKALDVTGAVSVPKPISVVNTPGGGSAIVMQFVEMTSLRKFQEKLGEDLARLHQWTPDPDQREGKFGFHVDTCCGYIPMVNSWSDDWVSFYTQQRLGEQIRLVEEKTGDKEATELWSRLQLKIPKFFEGIEVKPSLLHGDLWGGNVAETGDGPGITLVLDTGRVRFR
ncbi:ketosamine-3-kinase-like isoform X2 [Ischnura elegans]|uniref:ketosamine-3-kinase-like isoform X2 n=1 Tax=Ischnura elegans TaxID=197161 RepID=UPI001ED88974|nr:ketosamine-3-kinase-like isoform X2 [Ischnura elegans]